MVVVREVEVDRDSYYGVGVEEVEKRRVGVGIVNGMWVVFFFFKQKPAYGMLRSLVGSEMFIRARPAAEPGSFEPPPARPFCPARVALAMSKPPP